MILLIYALTSTIVLDMCIYCARQTEGFHKENIFLTVIMTLFSPLALIITLSTFTYEHLRDRKRAECARIMSSWESLARKNSAVQRWDWYMSLKNQEERFNLLRESIRSMSDKDLNVLIGTNKNTFEIDKPLREAIVDELIERRIMKND